MLFNPVVSLFLKRFFFLRIVFFSPMKMVGDVTNIFATLDGEIPSDDSLTTKISETIRYYYFVIFELENVVDFLGIFSEGPSRGVRTLENETSLTQI